MKIGFLTFRFDDNVRAPLRTVEELPVNPCIAMGMADPQIQNMALNLAFALSASGSGSSV